MALGFVAKEDVLTLVRFQNEERAKGNEASRLGELLVERELCSPEQRDMAMKLQNLLRGVE